MARGKHQQSKAFRDLKALQARHLALTDELAVEQQRLEDAQAEADAVADLRRQVAAAVAAREAATGSETEQVRRDLGALMDLVAQFEGLAKDVDRAWQTLSGSLANRLGGGMEAWEQVGHLTGAMEAGAVIAELGRSGMDVVAAERIGKARGERRISRPVASSGSSRNRIMPDGMVRHSWTVVTAGHQAGGPDSGAGKAASAVGEAVAGSRVDELWLDAVHGWHPVPLIDYSAAPILDSQVMQQLGVAAQPKDAGQGASSAASDPGSIRFTPTMTASQRSDAASSGPEATEASWAAALRGPAAAVAATARLSAPWQSPPPYPRPGDAVAFRQWYALAAIGAWSRLVDRDGVKAAAAAGAAAAGLTAATPYWLPPGQAAAYAGSLELSEADRADLRLPYPQVLLTLSDPMVLPPTFTSVRPAGFDYVLQQADNAVLQLTRSGSENTTLAGLFRHIQVRDPQVLAALPALADVLAVRGALVEALLLLADDEGRPVDEFAWCLAVPAASGGVLGRFTIPARRSRTAFGSQVDNLAAVCAWADWHPPTRGLALSAHSSSRELAETVAGAEFRRAEPAGGVGGVHVLNVVRTESSDAPGDGTAARSTVAPHTRRGHWRRQRHGPGNSQTKRIRIAPTIVNAGRRGFAAQVYRLPAAPEG